MPFLSRKGYCEHYGQCLRLGVSRGIYYLQFQPQGLLRDCFASDRTSIEDKMRRIAEITLLKTICYRYVGLIVK